MASAAPSPAARVVDGEGDASSAFSGRQSGRKSCVTFIRKEKEGGEKERGIKGGGV